jgi:glycosyltransferase involved in cell wall biosynthesis
MTLGRVMVIPSRAESLPYVVLEAAAAGKPLITTNVGGIHEIFGPLSPALIPAGDAPTLAQAIAYAMREPAAMSETARLLRARVEASFSMETMVDGVLDGYAQALARLPAFRRASLAHV